MDSSSFIPVGDFLRQVLGNPLIKAKDIKDILRSRGVFSSSIDKKQLAPLLIKTGVSPQEFQYLKESTQTKEENPKILTRKMSWLSNKKLIEAVPVDFDFHRLIDDPFAMVSISNAPVFTVGGDGEDPNYIVAEVELLRKDQTRNFGESESLHKCSIELKIDPSNGSELNVTVRHSSKESLNFLNKVYRRLHKKFEEDKLISPDPVEEVLFDSFDNEGRIDFLMELSESKGFSLQSKEVKKIHISPDYNEGESLPEEIKWVEKNIEDLMLNGKDLGDSIFIKEKSFRKYFKLYTLYRRYSINPGGNEGVCVIKYYFVENENKSVSELAMEIESIKMDKRLSPEKKLDLKIKTLKMFDDKKIDLFRKFSIGLNKEDK